MYTNLNFYATGREQSRGGKPPVICSVSISLKNIFTWRSETLFLQCLQVNRDTTMDVRTCRRPNYSSSVFFRPSFSFHTL